MPDDYDENRRQFLVAGTIGIGGAIYASAGQASSTLGQAAPVDQGAVIGQKVTLPSIQADSEQPSSPPPNPDAPPQRIGFAVMGLGRLSLENILPAFASSKHAYLAGLISGDPEKMRTIARQYAIAAESCYSYEDLAKLRNNDAVQVVYVVLPNALHRDAVVQLAQAGKHVLCEKPMATSVDEAREMIDACRRANRKLMIAYRCQYEVNNRELSKRARAGALGEIQLIDAVNTQNQGNPTQWRQVKKLAGGGSLPDVGLYCLNTTRALLGEEPIEVSATIHSPENDVRFKEVESTVSFTLRFASGVIANCASSYSLHANRNFRVFGSKATAEITDAFSYEGQKLTVSQRDGLAEAKTQLNFGVKNQFSLELDHMALCVRNNIIPRTPGEEGLQDQVLMAAIYESARTAKPIKLVPVGRKDAFRGPPPDEGEG